MPIYKITKNKIERYQLQENGFGSEFGLRDLFAENLEELLGIRFLAKEYPTLDGRIDTLGLDENNTPVIIEYKWKENEEVLAQGLFYFNWLLKNKRHFELLVENKLGKTIKVNWDQPRVLLIARGFGKYIIGAVEQEKNVELISYSYYKPDILHLEAVYTPKTSHRYTKTKRKTGQLTYDLEYHLDKTSKEMQQIFLELQQNILALPGVIEKTNQKSGITYKTTKSFARFEFRPSWIMVLLRDAHYPEDIQNLVKDVTGNDWGYKGMLKLDMNSSPEYVLKLIEKSYLSTQ